MKKVLLVIIDALASRVIRPAMEQGRLPTLQRLAELGGVNWHSTSIFPSITPAATSSLLTGTYPREHGVLGAHFYDRTKDRVHYYGSDIWLILSESVQRFFDDFLVQLNHDRLSAQTCFEIAEASGKEAASLNYMIYRGKTGHTANTPFLLKLLPGIPASEKLSGPSTLCVGDFVRSGRAGRELGREFGIAGRFGFCDESTGELLLELAQEGLPDFTVAYFPDNDFESHKRGPAEAVAVVEKVDGYLERFFDEVGGIEAAISEYAIVVTGDHSQSELNDTRDEVAIDIEDLLSSFSQASPDREWSGNEEVMICSNLRSAQIYCRKEAGVNPVSVVDALMVSDRIDQVILCEQRDGRPWFRVSQTQGRTLEFATSTDSNAPRDAYGQGWELSGDLRALDATIDSKNQIHFGDYPNGLERIASVFAKDLSGDIWVTAKPGYEFSSPGASLHVGGGSHGSLHVDDSTSPLFCCGLPKQLAMPRYPRSVDIAPLCLEALGVACDLKVGMSHALATATTC